jgi:hypothetical protein
MKTAEELYKEATKEVHDSGNYGLHSMAIIAIEKAQKDMFKYLYRQAELDENKDLSLEEFFDKMDMEILF